MDIKKEMVHHLDAIGLIVSKKMVSEDQVAREVRNVMRTTGFKLLEKAKAPTDELHSMICLSMGHVSKETAQDFEGPNEFGTMPIFYEKREYGWFVYVSKEVETDKDYPADIVDLLAYARARGCGWIMLDQDGPVVDGLKTWEW
jgi:hypothetical protein